MKTMMMLIFLCIVSLTAQTIDLHILETTDVHTYLLDYDYYNDSSAQAFGLVHTAYLIDQYRNQHENILLFDNGDWAQGTPMSDYIAKIEGLPKGAIHPYIRAVNVLQYDALGLGNHEFNYGLPFLYRMLQDAIPPVLCANIHPIYEQAPWKPYVILKKQCIDNNNVPHILHIGVISVVPPKIQEWDKMHLKGKITTIPMVETVRHYVQHLRHKTDVIIVLCHGGISHIPNDEENPVVEISQIQGIDGILAGHTHVLFPNRSIPNTEYIQYDKGLVHNTPVVIAANYGMQLGIIQLTLEKNENQWQVIDKKASLQAIQLGEKDEKLEKLLQDVHKRTIEYTNQELGKVSSPLHSYFAQIADSSLLQFINEGQKWYVENYFKDTPQKHLPVLSAAAPFKCGGRAYSELFSYIDVPAGKLAIKDMANVYSYANTIYAVQISGKMLREWLEISVSQFNQIETGVKGPQELVNRNFDAYSFDVIDGVTYLVDVSLPARYNDKKQLIHEDAYRIQDLQYNGQPVTDDQEFIVATNNYRAGSKFFADLPKHKIYQFQDQVREILIQFLQAKKDIQIKADNNWKIKQHDGYPYVIMITSPEARKYENEIPYIMYEQPSETETGFIQYRVILD
ncbi:MAG TPA: bifunctional 2',3'-cyclic-nucleotide 2'-phosphodiesterase/3'-nucleotidase [Planctomycetota bacterium]|nr:bifunctional 2',3'-cyclic-nucleotide 2'-phosphodiesterase/3'-nucleotidase [Planctomycetota bacterium]HQA99565.1 bifunctional 2',3'-cyclic-nucleotide 2'-phosphodiesterase/3'-nucleotidase [Planctomycetota bacterium]